MGKPNVSNAVLSPSETVSQFVIRQLLAGLGIQVTIDGKIYDGYVHQLDFGKGANYVFANVHVPDLDEKSTDGIMSIKVAIYPDGTVIFIPDSDDK